VDETLLEPNPRTVSRELLTRKEFIPATTLNLLAGAWIQFEVHDWFSHGQNEEQNPWKIELAADDPWPQHPMEIQRTRRDPSADPTGSPTFVTADTHWWDGSQVYGSDPKFAQAWSGVSQASSGLYGNSVPTPELAQHAREAAEKAPAAT